MIGWEQMTFSDILGAMNFHRSLDKQYFDFTPPYKRGYSTVWVVAFKRKGA